MIDKLIAKYNIDIAKLNEEQKKLSSLVDIKKKINYEDVNYIAGCEVVDYINNLIASIIVIDKEKEIIEQKFFMGKARFPYLLEYRAYRALPVLMKDFDKLENKPDLIFVHGHGIDHPRGLGLASHFGISVNLPTIGISSRPLCGEIKGNELIFKGKIVGEFIKTKDGSNPVLASPGHLINLKQTVEISKQFVDEKYKRILPLHLAHKFGKSIKKEFIEKKTVYKPQKDL